MFGPGGRYSQGSVVERQHYTVVGQFRCQLKGGNRLANTPRERLSERHSGPGTAAFSDDPIPLIFSQCF